MVVLHEAGIDSSFFDELALVVTLEEKAPVVAEYIRLEYQYVGDVGRNDVHWKPLIVNGESEIGNLESGPRKP
jgi:hypothetical protein